MAVKGTTLAVSFAIFYILQVFDAAIVPAYENYTATVSNDVTIPWTYDYEADMSTVDWSYLSSSSSTPTIIMSKNGTAAAQVFNNYNVEHVSNGEIKLKTVTMDNAGIYLCAVFYTLASGLKEVTGTATLSVTGISPAVCLAQCIVSGCLMGAFLCGLIVGIVLIHQRVLTSKWKDIPVWVWILCPSEIGLGILITWMIWDGGLDDSCRPRRLVCICSGEAFFGNHIATIVVVCVLHVCPPVVWVWILAPCIIGLGVMIAWFIWKYCCNHADKHGISEANRNTRDGSSLKMENIQPTTNK